MSINDYPDALRQNTILIGRYRIEDVLGKGGFGITYKAMDQEKNQAVAIKEYYPAGLSSRRSDSQEVIPFTKKSAEYYEYGKKQFLEEAERLHRFRREPGIVSVRQFFTSNNTAYFVMEFVEGRDLKQYLQERGGRIGWHQACDILLPVMRTLEQVHKEGIIHRDIAPDNIFIDKYGNAKLLDFGAARSNLGNESGSVDAIVKHGFSPIEQYSRNSKSQGTFTDVYALAATFYYVITGTIPEDSMDRLASSGADKIDLLKSPRDLGADCPPALEKVLRTGLAIRSENRFQTMREFRESVEQAAGIKEFTDEQKTPVLKTGKILLAAAAVAVVLFIGSRFIPGFIRKFGQEFGQVSDSHAEKQDNPGQEEHKTEAITDNSKEIGTGGGENNSGNNSAVDNALPSGQSSYDTEVQEDLLSKAKHGDVEAQYTLGEKYFEGIDVSQDYEEAMKWFMQAAGKEDCTALNWVGYMYFYGYGVPLDYNEALKWFTKAADQNSSYAQYYIGLIYQSESFGNNDDEAFKWMLKAADQNYASAQNSVGNMYYCGKGTEKDYEKAFFYFLKSAEQGNASAQYNTGLMYEYGKGVEINLEKAHEWYSKAAGQGNESAKDALESLEQKMTPGGNDYSK